MNCFRPQEIFNINTHALFQYEKTKDPLDSDDESNDDEEDIVRLLSEKEPEEPPNVHTGNKKIDLKAYNPSKSIDYNIKVLRKMINNAKQATNTNRAVMEA